MFRMMILVRIEFEKMLRMKLVLFLLLSLTCLIIFWGVSSDYFFPDRASPGTGYEFLLSSNQTTMSFIGSIFVLIYSSLLISGEMASATLQSNLVNPVSRGEFFFAKLISGWGFSLLLVLSMALPGFLIGGLKYGYGPYVEEGLIIYSQSQIMINIVIALLTLWMIMLAYVSYGLLISVSTSNPGYAIGISVGSILMADLLKGGLKIGPMLFQTYIEAPYEYAKSMPGGIAPEWRIDIARSLGVSIVWTMIFVTIAYSIFKRKDFKN